jgi:hypothetical protein
MSELLKHPWVIQNAPSNDDIKHEIKQRKNMMAVHMQNQAMEREQ